MMETINNYLEGMFKNLPETEEIKKIKRDLYFNMEDKYNELKNEGKSENEAIGIVISEFGNIDELLEEMGINNNTTTKNKDNNLKNLTYSEIKNYITLKFQTSKLVSIGVMIIMFAVSLFIAISSLIEDKVIFGNYDSEKLSNIPLIILIVSVAGAVALFISCGIKMEKYKYIDEGKFILDKSTKIRIENERKDADFSSSNIIVGVTLCIFAAIPILISDIIDNDVYSDVAVSITIFIVAFAVYIFINTGIKKEVYKKILKEEEFSETGRKNEKFIGMVASIVWPIVVCIFLICGLAFNLWHIAWIVFPITGILFGVFATVVNNR